jgi:hypothetical protein
VPFTIGAKAVSESRRLLLPSQGYPQVIGRILAHLEQTKPASGSAADLTTAHRARGPPGQGEFDLN